MNKNEILSSQDLAGADLSGASLGGMNLAGKNLRGADLSHAHLGAADLSGADLRNANLNQANLGAANLRGADLRFADVREANLAGANLVGADLREAIGLESTSHSAAAFVKPVVLEETDDYLSAQQEGYLPLAHWGKNYKLDNGKTLYRQQLVWKQLKGKLGDSIFGDRTTFSEVRLVQQYKHYSQWAYMISKTGFERIATGLGLNLNPK